MLPLPGLRGLSAHRQTHQTSLLVPVHFFWEALFSLDKSRCCQFSLLFSEDFSREFLCLCGSEAASDATDVILEDPAWLHSVNLCSGEARPSGEVSAILSVQSLLPPPSMPVLNP